MSSREFSAWVEFYRNHPFGSERDNLHAAMITAMIGNVNRGKSSKPLEVNDFMVMSQKHKKEDETRCFLSGLAALAVPKMKEK